MSRSSGADPAADDDVRAHGAQPEGPDPDPMVEVEYGGQTYAVPAELTGALMRHADYTRQTQALAQQRQALEAGHQALTRMADDQNQHLADHARVMTLNDHIHQLSQVDWPGLQQQDPAQAQQLMTQLAHLKQAHEIAVGRLQHKQAVRAFSQQRQHAMQVSQSHAMLSQQIDGWSPQMANRLAQYALSQGITPEELNGLSDPRLVMILHHASAGQGAQQQTSAAQRLARTQSVRPAIEVGGTGGGPKDPNRMSTDDWMRHRRGQLRSKTR